MHKHDINNKKVLSQSSLTEEEYSIRLEKITDELEQQQLLYLQTEILTDEEDKNDNYKKWMEEQLELINQLIVIHDSLKNRELIKRSIDMEHNDGKV